MLELRITLQTNCWEAGGRQLPSYITVLTVSSADCELGGVLGLLEARAGKNVNRKRDKKRERTRETERGTAWSEKQIKLEGGKSEKEVM